MILTADLTDSNHVSSIEMLCQELECDGIELLLNLIVPVTFGNETLDLKIPVKPKYSKLIKSISVILFYCYFI